MPRSQRGGFLEPLQKTPPFKYTTNPERIAWISMIYPYAPYFFNLFKEIPWAEFRYEDDEVVATTDMEFGPYGITGGCYFELLNKEYASVISSEARLHNFVDPTGDIDVILNGLCVETKIPGANKITGYYKFTPKHTNVENENNIEYDVELHKFSKAYIHWLLDHTETYFKSLSYNFSEWFPNAVTDYGLVQEKIKLGTENVSQFKLSDFTTLRQVGPFLISALDFGSEPRIQVSMLHRVPDGNIVLDHFIELLFWNGVNKNPIYKKKFLLLPTLQIHINDMMNELRENNKALRDRLENEPKYFYKFLNHLYRPLFFLWFIVVCTGQPQIMNAIGSKHEAQTVPLRYYVDEIYGNKYGGGITQLVKEPNAPNAYPYIYDFLKRLPAAVRIQHWYPTLHPICQTIGKTDEECGLPKPKNGGSRRTCKQKRRRKFRVSSRHIRK